MQPAPTYQAQPVAGRGGAGMATTALVLGILAILTSFTVIGGVLLGVLAIVFGAIAARRARRGLGLGRGRAIAGVVTGIIGVLLAVLLIAVGVSVLNSPAGKNLRDCLSNAHGDQQKIQQCNDQYRNQVTNNG
jgi:hypothetical protein